MEMRPIGPDSAGVTSIKSTQIYVITANHKELNRRRGRIFETQSSHQVIDTVPVKPRHNDVDPAVALLDKVFSRAAPPAIVHPDRMLPFQLKQCQFIGVPLVKIEVNIRKIFSLLAKSQGPTCLPARLVEQTLNFFDPTTFTVVRKSKPVFLIPRSKI